MTLSDEIECWWQPDRSTVQALEAHLRRLTLDTVACAIAGLQTREVSSFEHARAVSSPGNVVFPGGKRALNASAAASVGAMAACWFEFCEGHELAQGRPGLHVVPLALALGAALDKTYGEVLRATLIGYEIGARAGIGEHRGVLAVAFEEDRLARHRVHPRIEGGERGRGAEGVVAVVHHAVRVAIRLGKEGFLGALLARGAGLGLFTQPHSGERAGHHHQHGKDQARQQHHARACPQPPFLAGNAQHRAHAVSRAAKAAWTASVSIRPPLSAAAKLPTSRPPRSRPTRSATWHAP